MAALTLDDRKLIAQALDIEGATPRHCPFCEHEDHDVMAHLGIIPTGGGVFPMALVMCGRCKHVRMHSIVELGLDDIVDRYVAS